MKTNLKKIILDRLPDKIYYKLVFRRRMGYSLNLKNPKTFNEKLQWLKLYDRNPKYTSMVDKYEAKKVASEVIGKNHIIKTYGVWNSFDEIDFDSLPNQFVLKCTHNSGGIVICKDKSKFDFDTAKDIISKCLSQNFYFESREWPYKDVRPRIIAEKYMRTTEDQGIDDYKFFCFNGVVKTMFIATRRMSKLEDTCFDFYDSKFQHLNVKSGHPNSPVRLSKPDYFEEMISIAERLSKGLPEVRIDLYEVNGTVYFGEYTFFHWGGLTPFEPESFDRWLGDQLILPEKF